MSTTANWSYTNIATVWPHTTSAETGGGWGGGTSDEYGAPYQIACTWVGGGDVAVKTATNHNGIEFAPKMTYFHEDKRVKFGDLIARGVTTDRTESDPIQAHDEFDMSFFGEEPDFRSVT